MRKIPMQSQNLRKTQIENNKHDINRYLCFVSLKLYKFITLEQKEKKRKKESLYLQEEEEISISLNSVQQTYKRENAY